jgi:hypothetical protein
MSKVKPKPGGKYQPRDLIKMFRLAAELRNEMIEAGFTDNGGAIHSASRILDILGLRVNYPGLSHINKLRHWPGAEFSKRAENADRRGQKVLIEHVAPLRALTCRAIEKTRSKRDGPLLRLIREHYRLVLLTPEETARLNRLNRSAMDPNRLARAGITTIRRR